MVAFVTFEGIEGCGKSTQVRLLSERLKEEGVPCVVTREPGGTSIGVKIREILLNPDHKGMSSKAELLLYAADRAQHVTEKIRPALDSGKVVICDRFTDATLAYQGYGRGLDRKLIVELNRIASDGLRPDITLLLDCPVEIGLERAIRRNLENSGAKDDRFEREELDFHERVRSGYMAVAKDEPGRVKVVDASAEAEVIHRKIWVLVSGFVKRAGSPVIMKHD